MTKRFTRTVEDFTCAHCGAQVAGGGYTNHCPRCLWSRHVDVNPGDRAATCGGLMEPVAVETRRGEYMIVHRCVKCGTVCRNRSAPTDDPAAILALAGRAAPTTRRTRELAAPPPQNPEKIG